MLKPLCFGIIQFEMRRNVDHLILEVKHRCIGEITTLTAQSSAFIHGT